MRNIAAVIAFLTLVTAACSSSSGPSGLCANSGAAATVSATDNLTFSPSSVTITHGQSVCWQNSGAIAHTVTDNATGGGVFNGNLPGGQTFLHTFASAGTFGYHCNIHSGMSGTITVN